jgi:hypothetical protein
MKENSLKFCKNEEYREVLKSLFYSNKEDKY